MKKWKGYERGINLGGWLSQCEHSKEHYDTFIQKEDLETINSWGLDHVRLPLDYELIQNSEGTFIEDGFSYIQQVIDWCGEYHLNLILDLHKTAGYSFDAGEKEEGFFESNDYQERFYQLWEELARRYSTYKDRLAFELLNEVVDKAVCETWNQIAKTCIQRIRRISGDVTILVGGYWNNSISAVPDLLMPTDENIVYNFHCYEPLAFTHQGAPWVNGMPHDFRISCGLSVEEIQKTSSMLHPDWLAVFSEVKDKSRTLDQAFFTDIFAKAVAIAEERNVSLYCGEYGVIDLAAPEETVRWYQAIHQAFEHYGIGRAAWTYRAMDFGLSDPYAKEILPQIITLL